MTATTFHKRSPFTGEPVKPVRHVNPKSLRIATDECPVGRTSKFKYDEVFEKLEPGQCVVCEWNETNRVSAAMRSYIRRNGLDYQVKSSSYYTTTAPTGRVWLI